MGALSELLNSNITEQTDKQAMADAAGIELSTLNQILSGDIECPPKKRIADLAAYVGISVDALESAGESDGCNYEDMEAHARTLGDLT